MGAPVRERGFIRDKKKRQQHLFCLFVFGLATAYRCHKSNGYPLYSDIILEEAVDHIKFTLSRSLYVTTANSMEAPVPHIHLAETHERM